MRSVRAVQSFQATVAQAERCWCDTSGWPRWVDGLERVLEVGEAWPQPGAGVTWESGPAGRGRVSERVSQRRSLHSLDLDVDDPSIRGRQSVTFTPADPGVEVALSLEYELKRRSPMSALVDRLFIRRAMAASLSTTLTRFGHELHRRRRSSA